MKARLQRIRSIAGAVADPEIPVLTLADLGIVRDVRAEDEHILVELTPTYSGCPATEIIAEDVRAALRAAGEAGVEIRIVLSPPWTTDWISAAAREKLRAWGIAPPACSAETAQTVRFLSSGDVVRCPRCGSANTERLSEFGSTPCKSLYRCVECREPFDYFKPF